MDDTKTSFITDKNGINWIPFKKKLDLEFLFDEYTLGNDLVVKCDSGVQYARVSKKELKKFCLGRAKLIANDKLQQGSDIVCNLNDHEVSSETKTCPACFSPVNDND